MSYHVEVVSTCPPPPSKLDKASLHREYKKPVYALRTGPDPIARDLPNIPSHTTVFHMLRGPGLVPCR